MKAISFAAPAPDAATTTLLDVSDPTPAPGEVLIAVDHAGVNFIDVMARRGDPGYAAGWPYRPGLEVAGLVVATGSPDSPFRMGDRVAAFTGGGGLAELAVADEALVAAIPDDLDTARAAAAPLMLSTAILLLNGAARLQPGDTVLMHAAGGGVGSAVAQLANVFGGGTLIGTVADAAKAGAPLAAGWHHVLVRDEKLGHAIRELAPDGVDVVLDPLGTEMLAIDTAAAAPAARIVLFGNPGGSPLEALPHVGHLIRGNMSIGGFSISRLAEAAPQRVTAALLEGLTLLAEGRVQLPLIELGGLGAVPDAHQALAEGRSAGKYVVRVE